MFKEIACISPAICASSELDSGLKDKPPFLEVASSSLHYGEHHQTLKTK
jgi:hypothetical protein